jgi:hypothetical protein
MQAMGMESRRYAVGEDLTRRWHRKSGIQRSGRAVRDGESGFVEDQFRQRGCGRFRELDASARVERLESFRDVRVVDEKIMGIPSPNLFAGQVKQP